MVIKNLQFPDDIKREITRLRNNRSAVLSNSFYSTYLGKRERCYSKIVALMHCYRVFKEARNCYMHNGSKADIKLTDAYAKYSPFSTPEALDVSEVPEFLSPVLGEEIRLSLRGVVGFSYILIKILVSLDTELLCTANAEEEFISRYKEKHTLLRALKPDADKAKQQVSQYVRQCGFPTPLAVDDLILFLLSHHLVSR